MREGRSASWGVTQAGSSYRGYKSIDPELAIGWTLFRPGPVPHNLWIQMVVRTGGCAKKLKCSHQPAADQVRGGTIRSRPSKGFQAYLRQSRFNRVAKKV